MFVRTKQGERRLSASLYKLLLTAHIIVSVGWLGVVVPKLALGLAAATAAGPEMVRALYTSMAVVNPVFPPLAISTAVTGVLLGLGTRWGLFQYYWVVAKIAVTVTVPATAIALEDRLLQQATGARPAPVASDGALLVIVAAPTLLILLHVAHALMLGAATVASVYKPWGKTWFGRRMVARQSAGARNLVDGRGIFQAGEVA